VKRKTERLWVIAFVFTVSLVAGMQTIEGVRANLIPVEKPTNPPPIIIQSPSNITYYQSEVPLNFTIVGISQWWIGAYHLTDVYYECDDRPVHLYVDSTINTEQFFTTLVGLTKGEHTLTVHVNGTGLYYTNYRNSSDKAEYSIESTQTVTFTVDKDVENTLSPLPSEEPTPSTIPPYTPTPTITLTQSPSITPTQAQTESPTPSPTLTPNPITDGTQTEEYTSTIILYSIITAAIAVGILFYLKKKN
jgi:hypothetical protein